MIIAFATRTKQKKTVIVANITRQNHCPNLPDPVKMDRVEIKHYGITFADSNLKNRFLLFKPIKEIGFSLF